MRIHFLLIDTLKIFTSSCLSISILCWISPAFSQELAIKEKKINEEAAMLANDNCSVIVRFIEGLSDNKAQGAFRKEDNKRIPHFVTMTKQKFTGQVFPEMESQLSPLPFVKFNVVDGAEKELSLEEEGVFVVSDALSQLHRISVIPKSFEPKWVNLLVDWRDPFGFRVVQASLRVINGKCLVLGTDKSSTGSVILAVRASCPAK